MRSYIKIIGPPVLKAIKELEKIAIDMPEVCIMDETILRDIPRSLARDLGEPFEYSDNVMHYFTQRTGVRVKTERCKKIISKSGELLGDYDFFFEWFEKPTFKQVNDLIKTIDEALIPIGCLYTISTKK
jgi:hypothetical protein